MLTRGQHASLKNEFLEALNTIQRDGVSALKEYLETTDFYTAPARSSNGCSYPGGLLEYTLDVYHILKDKAGLPVWSASFADMPIESIAVVSLLHSLCKIGAFEIYYANRKNHNADVVAQASNLAPQTVKRDAEGEFVWEEVKGYRYADSSPFEDGTRSVMTALRFIKLSEQEIEAIGCHRGFVSTAKSSSIADVFGKNPLALALYESVLEAAFVVERDKI